MRRLSAVHSPHRKELPPPARIAVVSETALQESKAPLSQTCQVMARGGKICGQPIISEKMPFCSFHARMVDNKGTHRYMDILPEKMQETYSKHLVSGEKNLGAEIAVSRTILSTLLSQLERGGKTSLLLEKLVNVAANSTVDANGNLLLSLTVTPDEHAALVEAERNSKALLSPENAELLMRSIHIVKSTVESQAKVNPEWVVTLAEMKEIIDSLIDVIDAALPAENLELRAKVVNSIEEQIKSKLTARAIKIGFGAQPEKGQAS